MARGWGRSEEDLGADKEQLREEGRAKEAASREDPSRAARRRSLEMALARIEEQLARTSHPDRRCALEMARRELLQRFESERASSGRPPLA